MYIVTNPIDWLKNWLMVPQLGWIIFKIFWPYAELVFDYLVGLELLQAIIAYFRGDFSIINPRK